jgi:hypothetical protein
MTCEHAEIVTYIFADTRKASGLWACKSCQTKFVPLDLDQEKDAARYRWVRQAGAFDSEIGLDALSENPEKYDAAVDSKRG